MQAVDNKALYPWGRLPQGEAPRAGSIGGRDYRRSQASKQHVLDKRTERYSPTVFALVSRQLARLHTRNTLEVSIGPGTRSRRVPRR